MGTCSETIYKHQILFPSIHHLAWLPQGRPQGKQKCGKIAIFGLTHWLKHSRPITRKLLKIDKYMLRGVWQALNCLSIHGTYRVIVAGASAGETKLQKCGLWYVKTASFCTCGSNNWETVEDRWVHAARGLTSVEVWQALNCLSIHATCCVIIAGASPEETKNVGCGTWKRRFFALAVRLTGCKGVTMPTNIFVV